ncbi:MAG: hypothetical protein EAZ42_01995 [Verrucomicrobia bacterium]|nr:MAG: hypothetical protein EAZ42_01995 [Verrucomicrobiota bacterium]
MRNWKLTLSLGTMVQTSHRWPQESIDAANGLGRSIFPPLCSEDVTPLHLSLVAFSFAKATA